MERNAAASSAPARRPDSGRKTSFECSREWEWIKGLRYDLRFRSARPYAACFAAAHGEEIKLFASIDSYNRQARIYPVLLSISPILVVAVACLSQLPTVRATAMMVAGVTSFGVVYLLSELGRSLGKGREAKMQARWGPKPAVQMLRQIDGQLARPTKERYRLFLAEHALNEPLPDEESEKRNPGAADEIYESMVQWLREQCRGPTFGLVEKESASYGFRRNMYGLKPIGVVTSIVSTAVVAFVIGTSVPWDRDGLELANVDQGLLLAGTFSLSTLAFWLVVVRASWVRESATQYATALLACCDRLREPGTKPLQPVQTDST